MTRFRAINFSATASFDIRGHDSVAGRRDEVDFVLGAAEDSGAAPTSLATIRSQPFLPSLARAFSMTFSVSAAKPTTTLGRLV